MSWGPGHTLFLTADGLDSPETPGSAWRYSDVEAQHYATPLAADAVRTRTRMRELARLALAGVPNAGALPNVPAQARKVASTNTTPPSSVQGASIGLPVFLAAVSRILELPLPPHLASTGEVLDTGAIAEVAGIASKMKAAEKARVRRVLVPKPNLAQAQAGTTIEVVAVSTIGEAVAVAFGDGAFEAALDRAFERDPQRAVDALFDIALGNARSFLPAAWMAKNARLLTTRLAPGSDPAWRAQIAEAIFDRHAGRPHPLPPGSEAWIDTLPSREVRLKLTSHALQGCADAATPDWEPIATRAAAAVASRHDRGTGDGWVLGALGRLYASWHRWPAALAHLEAAVQVWEDTHFLAEASIPVCEWLRVTALAAPEQLPRVVRVAERVYAAPQLPAQSAAYIPAALVTAHVLAGDMDAARARFAEVPDSLAAAAQRWLAIGGDTVEEARLDGEDRAILALLRGEAAGEELDATELGRLRHIRPGASGAWIARHWRY